MIETRISSIAEILATRGLQQGVDAYVSLANPDMPPATPDWKMYKQLEDCGALTVLGSFDDGALAGILFLTVTPVPHYSCLLASTESIFVLEPYRKRGVGLELLRLAEKTAKEKGAKGIITSAILDSRYAKAMARLGYRPTHTLYAKGFGDE
jgi:GNAT superfamily N-acetyltransferase